MILQILILTIAFQVVVNSSAEIPKNENFDCGIANVTSTLLERIIGGGESEPGEWPWTVYVKYGNSFCGGTLITKNHVLTAAHCVSSDIGRMVIKVGEYYAGYSSKQSGVRRGAKKIAIHPGYRVLWDLPDGPSIDDISVITLDKPVEFTDVIRPICLTDETNNYAGKMATTIGYGAVGPSGPNSDVLRELTIPVWTNDACQVVHDRAPVLDTHICAGEPGKAGCFGDSGGPLMIKENGKWYQIGVTGWVRETCDPDYCEPDLCEKNLCGDHICDPQYPTVYARVSSYMPWIKEQIK